MSNPLELVLVLLASAVLVVVLARSLHLPPVLASSTSTSSRESLIACRASEGRDWGSDIL